LRALRIPDKDPALAPLGPYLTVVTEATSDMAHTDLMQRITSDPTVAGGRPCIRGTRIYMDIILDGMAEGLTVEQIIDHYPQLTPDDVRAALAYAAELTRETVWKLAA
jgi:uncharacterized protein (DUF433 family)